MITLCYFVTFVTNLTKNSYIILLFPECVENMEELSENLRIERLIQYILDNKSIELRSAEICQIYGCRTSKSYNVMNNLSVKYDFFVYDKGKLLIRKNKLKIFMAEYKANVMDKELERLEGLKEEALEREQILKEKQQEIRGIVKRVEAIEDVFKRESHFLIELDRKVNLSKAVEILKLLKDIGIILGCSIEEAYDFILRFKIDKGFNYAGKIPEPKDIFDFRVEDLLNLKSDMRISNERYIPRH